MGDRSTERSSVMKKGEEYGMTVPSNSKWEDSIEPLL